MLKNLKKKYKISVNSWGKQILNMHKDYLKIKKFIRMRFKKKFF